MIYARGGSLQGQGETKSWEAWKSAEMKERDREREERKNVEYWFVSDQKVRGEELEVPVRDGEATNNKA